MSEAIQTHDTKISEFSPERIKVIVFDVDDTVIRGTLGIKTEMWDELFSDRLGKLQEARELYEYTGLGDRYNMIAHIIGESQEGCRENENVTEWADKFEAMTMEKIREGGIHEDDLQSLIRLKENFSGPVYLLSATPQAVVEGNIRHFEEIYPEIKGMFTRIIGTPMCVGKAGELSNIADERGISASEVLMVGDGGSDYLGARGSGSQFVGIVPEGKENKWKDEDFPQLTSIAELPTLLKIS